MQVLNNNRAHTVGRTSIMSIRMDGVPSGVVQPNRRPVHTALLDASSTHLVTVGARDLRSTDSDNPLAVESECNALEHENAGDSTTTG